MLFIALKHTYTMKILHDGLTKTREGSGLYYNFVYYVAFRHIPVRDFKIA
jgi:hypothetical protein